MLLSITYPGFRSALGAAQLDWLLVPLTISSTSSHTAADGPCPRTTSWAGCGMSPTQSGPAGR
jgi:hypothetical protein